MLLMLIDILEVVCKDKELKKKFVNLLWSLFFLIDFFSLIVYKLKKWFKYIEVVIYEEVVIISKFFRERERWKEEM